MGWSFEPSQLVPIAVVAVLYARRARTLARRGRYHTMFDLQASRFTEGEFVEAELDEQGEEVVHDTLG